MNELAHLECSHDQRIAYHNLRGEGDGATLPGIIFLGGFRSDMTGRKATWLEAWAQQSGRQFTRFDYRGHGASIGRFEDLCISDWLDDACKILDRIAIGPQILVGSSMGGWISLLLAERRSERIAGLVAIAAAPDFTEDLWNRRLTEEQRAAIKRDGVVYLPSAYDTVPYPITRRLMDDGKRHLVLCRPWSCNFPVRLLHGTDDPDVSPDVSRHLMDHIQADDASLTLVKGGDHRFSSPECLNLLGRTLDEMFASDSL